MLSRKIALLTFVSNCTGRMRTVMFLSGILIRMGMGGGARANVHMRIRWETRLKTGSYAARCRKRAGRVRLEQRPVYRRTDPGTVEPGGAWEALTAILSPGITSSRNRGESSGCKGSTNPLLRPFLSPVLCFRHRKRDSETSAMLLPNV